MAAFTDTLRSGAWVTPARMRLVAGLILAFGLFGTVFLAATSDGRVDRFGRPLGTDFSNVYAAGTYVLEGKPGAPFDPRTQYAREQALFGTDTPFYGWHYPPFFLGLAALLAMMPYGAALLVWQGVTFVFYLLAIRTILSAVVPSALREEGQDEADRASRSSPPHPVAQSTADLSRKRRGEVSLCFLLALAFPAVFVNLGHGHNGFLTAALMGTALVVLNTRPVLAGILIGLMVYKPQFGVLIPLALIAGGYWRTFLAATATIAALALVIAHAFGTEVWTAFLASTKFTRTIVLEQGDTGWEKIQSVFSVARMWGGGIPLAYTAQLTVAIAIAASVTWLWRSCATFALKAAALAIGTILATPYALDYDLMLLAPAIAFLAANGLRRGFAPYEITALALLWLVPLVARSIAYTTMVPLAVPSMLLCFSILLRRAITESKAADIAGVRRERS